MANDVKWIKITTDMFDNRKIKHLRKLPDGNNIVLIWVMLLTMAGRCNAGGMIFLTENIPYTPKMLADELGFEVNTVQLALGALEQFNMIVTNNGYFTVAGWDEYQNIEGMEKIKEQNRLRQKKWYDRQKELQAPNVIPNVSITQPNATDIDIDKEQEKEVLPKGNTKKRAAKSKYGEYQHVMLTDNEYNNLADSFGVEVRDKAIKFLDEYIEEKGYKSKSHNLSIRRWVIDAISRERSDKPTQAQGNKGSFDVDDFFNAALSAGKVSPRAAIERQAIARMESKSTTELDLETARRAAELKEKLRGG